MAGMMCARAFEHSRCPLNTNKPFAKRPLVVQVRKVITDARDQRAPAFDKLKSNFKRDTEVIAKPIARVSQVRSGRGVPLLTSPDTLPPCRRPQPHPHVTYRDRR